MTIALLPDISGRGPFRGEFDDDGNNFVCVHVWRKSFDVLNPVLQDGYAGVRSDETREPAHSACYVISLCSNHYPIGGLCYLVRRRKKLGNDQKTAHGCIYL